MSIKLTAAGRGGIHNQNAGCTLRQVEECHDRATLKEWCRIVQQDIVNIKAQLAERSEDRAADRFDEDWHYRALDAKKKQKQLIGAIQQRLELLKAQEKLLGDEDFESYLIERVRQAMGEGFDRLLEQARRDYHYQKLINNPR